MANISQVEVNNTTYSICDAVARDSISQIEEEVANIFDSIYPIGSIYMSVNSTEPSTLFGGTWERIQDRFLLSAGSTYTAGGTGGVSTVTLTAAQSGVPAHAHGLNSHTHSVGAHSHGMGHRHTHAHTHSYSKSNTPTGSTTLTVDQIPSHNHVAFDTTSTNTGVGVTGVNIYYYIATSGANSTHTKNTGGSKGHTHTIGFTATNSAAASTNYTGNSINTGNDNARTSTDNSTAFNSGAASGNTANNTATNASAAHDNMPPYLTVYMWKRTA